MLTSAFDGFGSTTRRAGRRPAAGARHAVADRAAAPLATRRKGIGRRTVAGCRSARLGRFLLDRRGSVAVESTIAIGILVVVCGGLMAVAHAAYTDDRMGRAARAAARALAFVTEASPTQATLISVACDAIKRELQLEANFDCSSEWTLTVTTDLVPTALSSGTNPDGTTGDMILVKIGWEQAPWAGAVNLLEGSGGGAAVGVARREPTG